MSVECRILCQIKYNININPKVSRIKQFAKVFFYKRRLLFLNFSFTANTNTLIKREICTVHYSKLEQNISELSSEKTVYFT